jgi:hypothetical protein
MAFASVCSASMRCARRRPTEAKQLRIARSAMLALMRCLPSQKRETCAPRPFSLPTPETGSFAPVYPANTRLEVALDAGASRLSAAASAKRRLPRRQQHGSLAKRKAPTNRKLSLHWSFWMSCAPHSSSQAGARHRCTSLARHPACSRPVRTLGQGALLARPGALQERVPYLPHCLPLLAEAGIANLVRCCSDAVHARASAALARCARRWEAMRRRCVTCGALRARNLGTVLHGGMTGVGVASGAHFRRP